MKTRKHILSLASTWMVASVLFFASCNKTDDAGLSALEAENINNESATDAKVDEVNDIAASALDSNDAVSGRVEGADDRLACATVTKDATNTKESGKITIVFTGDCKDDDGDVRTGKIVISWSGGRWFVAKSVHTVTLDGYTVNGVKIDGSRSVTNVSTADKPLTFNIEGNHKTTWADGTTASRSVKRTRQWVRSALMPLQDRWIISQTDPNTPAASGTNRKGKSYSVQITTPLQYFASCGRRVHVPVIGVKQVTVDSKKFTVDYGDGTCDHLVTVTVDGKTKTMKIDKDGK